MPKMKYYNGSAWVELGASASNVSVADSGNHFTATNVEGALNELFTFANDGKTNIANAITAKGVSASSSDTFSTLATKIGTISTTPIKSRQIITNAIWNGSTALTKNITIPTPVTDINKCVAIVQHPNDGYDIRSTETYATFVDASTIQCVRNTGTNIPTTYIITIYEFDNVKTKQTGTVSGVTATVTVSAVDMNKCLLFIGSKSTGTTSAFPANQYYVSANTTITKLLADGNGTIYWQLIEFN